MYTFFTEDRDVGSKDLALFNLYKIGTGAATVLTVLISIVLFSGNMLPESRYLNDSSAVKVSLGLLVLNVLFALTPFFLFRKGSSKIGSIPRSCRYIFLLPSITAAASGIILLISVSGAVSVALFISALASALYAASFAVPVPKTLSLITGYCHILFCILVISSLYLDFSVEMNAPVKLFIQFAAMAAIVNTLSDLRAIIGKESVALFIFAKTSYIMLAFFVGTAAFIVVAPNIENYGIIYMVYPLYFFVLAVPTAVRFFSTTLCESRNVPKYANPADHNMRQQ